MAGPAHRPSLTALVLLCDAAAALPAQDASTAFELTVQTAPGLRTTRDQPMTVLWLEDANGRFVRTLWRFSHDKRYWPDLNVWKTQSAPVEKDPDLDAVTGATIVHGDSGQLRVPARWQGLDLLSGRYVLRAETRQDHAQHYSDIRIPLGPRALGRSFAQKGYVSAIELKACGADVAAPTAPTSLVAEVKREAPKAVETVTITGTVTKKDAKTFHLTLKDDATGEETDYGVGAMYLDIEGGKKLRECFVAVKVGDHLKVAYTESAGRIGMAFDPAPKKGK